MSNLTKETHNENELNKQNIKACCENTIKKYENNKIFEFLCKKDFIDYLNNPTLTNAKKIFKISKMEGILTAYKLFYVGCSRARKNLIIVVNEVKISKFQHNFIQKAKEIGFSVNTTLDF